MHCKMTAGVFLTELPELHNTQNIGPAQGLGKQVRMDRSEGRGLN